MASRTYKIRRFKNRVSKDGTRTFYNHSLTIPVHIAEQLPLDMTFECELVEDAILFRPAEPDAAAASRTTYRIRRFESAKGFYHHSLTVPVHIAEQLPLDTRFECELNEDGIWFLPVHIDLPSWATPNGKRRGRPAKPKAA